MLISAPPGTISVVVQLRSDERYSFRRSQIARLRARSRSITIWQCCARSFDLATVTAGAVNLLGDRGRALQQLSHSRSEVGGRRS